MFLNVVSQSTVQPTTDSYWKSAAVPNTISTSFSSLSYTVKMGQMVHCRYILIAVFCLVYFFPVGQGETVNETIANSHDDDNWSADALRTISFDEDESNPINVRGKRYASRCQKNQRYRTADGRCNNVRNPSAGASSTVYQRMAPANYADGKSVIRRSITGRHLPSARLISTTVFTNRNPPQENQATIMVMSFGQFFQHDITHITNAKLGNNIKCCSGSLFGTRTRPSPHKECFNIEVPKNDRLYNPPNQRGTVVDCIRFIRSEFRLNNGVREAINAHTHWMDLSQVYGNSLDQSKKLRSGVRGFLATSTSRSTPGRQFMKQMCCPGSNKCCGGSNCACFETGDDRANNNGPNLQMLHTIWLREHNRVAKQLARIIPGRTDEFYFQEARRIVIAEYQHITFTEFLPVFLGAQQAARMMKNRVHQQNANPAVFTEWSTAAFRVGHSMINTFMKLFEKNGQVSSQSFSVGDQINDFSVFLPNQMLIRPTFMDNLIRGLLKTHNDRADNAFAAFITGQLFKSPPGPGARLGVDLAAINIQRGRDHGLPTYAHFWAETQRQFGRNVRLANFDSLRSTTAPDVIALLKSVYASVNDIDLFVGGVTERPMSGSLIGPTFAYITHKQLENIKISDPFFYDLKNGPVTKDELAEIQKVSLSRIICDNSDGTITSIQPNAFKFPSGINQPVACNRLASVNLKKFKPKY